MNKLDILPIVHIINKERIRRPRKKQKVDGRYTYRYRFRCVYVQTKATVTIRSDTALLYLRYTQVRLTLLCFTSESRQLGATESPYRSLKLRIPAHYTYHNALCSLDNVSLFKNGCYLLQLLKSHRDTKRRGRFQGI